MEMGFEESEAISALRVAGNNQDTAVSLYLTLTYMMFMDNIKTRVS